MRADQFEVLIRACGVSPTRWLMGDGSDPPEDTVARKHRDLFTMLAIIIHSGNDDLIHGIRVNLDAISDKALRLKKARSPTLPAPGRQEAAPAARRRKGKQPA